MITTQFHCTLDSLRWIKCQTYMNITNIWYTHIPARTANGSWRPWYIPYVMTSCILIFSDMKKGSINLEYIFTDLRHLINIFQLIAYYYNNHIKFQVLNKHQHIRVFIFFYTTSRDSPKFFKMYMFVFSTEY